MIDQLDFVLVFHWEGAKTGLKLQEYCEVVSEYILTPRGVDLEAPLVPVVGDARRVDGLF